MLSKVGLARLECPGCGRTSYLPARGLLHAAVAACSYCHAPTAVADIEAGNPDLSRILVIMRQLADARTLHRQRGEGVTAAAVAATATDEAPSPVVSAEAQLA